MSFKEFSDDGYKWYAKEDGTGETVMHDRGSGETVDVRLYEWKLNPEVKVIPSEDEILTPDYMKLLNAELWSSGLRLLMKPRVSIKDGMMRIFVPCKAATGQSFLDKTKLLQEWTHQK